MTPLSELIARHKQGELVGITSVCSAHPWVIEAAMQHAQQNGNLLLVEATSNQVDQEGGYTGMTPQDFRQQIDEMAKQRGFDLTGLVLGGDHLGPNRWQHLPAEQAMEKAQVLVAHYVAAGFQKIHLDCSMSCAGDPIPLTDAIVAERAARLARICESVSEETWGKRETVYVIGTEVPVPGGAHESLEHLEVTRIDAAKQTLMAHQKAFAHEGIADIWPRVIGLVVQPGVEFSHDSVIIFQPEKAQKLSTLVTDYPHLVFEAHSTDYQPPKAYSDLVKNHFAILKVGPALTFALREALYALENIERELLPENQCSHLRQCLEQVMLEKPTFWQKYYTGSAQEQHIARHYSYSDRLRYYWPEKQVQNSIELLLANLARQPIPLPLLSQYLPEQYRRVLMQQLPADARALVLDRITDVLRDYASACH